MVGVRPECGSARKGKKQERDVEEARDRIVNHSIGADEGFCSRGENAVDERLNAGVARVHRRVVSAAPALLIGWRRS
jgi:hypothetical protein